MKRLSISVLCLSIPTLSATKTSAQNWPSFRGPNASGVAAGTKPPTTGTSKSRKTCAGKLKIVADKWVSAFVFQLILNAVPLYTH